MYAANDRGKENNTRSAASDPDKAEPMTRACPRSSWRREISNPWFDNEYAFDFASWEICA